MRDAMRLVDSTGMRLLVCAVGLSLCLPLRAAQLVLELENGVTQSWDTKQLLSHPESRELNVPNDVAYKHSMRCKALPVAVLLNDVSPEGYLKVKTLDNFTPLFPVAALLAREGARAWIAIEDPRERWPPLSNGQSPGPFYLVWTGDPTGREEWPYQVAGLVLLKRFPATLIPADDATADVREGLLQYQKHCLPCHSLNESGSAGKGPDLNLPHNPTEYFAADFLRQYIRNPKSVRDWSEANMRGFSEQEIDDRQLDDLLAYLRHMAGRKATVSSEAARSEVP